MSTMLQPGDEVKASVSADFQIARAGTPEQRERMVLLAAGEVAEALRDITFSMMAPASLRATKLGAAAVGLERAAARLRANIE